MEVYSSAVYLSLLKSGRAHLLRILRPAMQYQSRLTLLGLTSVLASAPALGQQHQISFGIDWHAPLIGTASSGVLTQPITEADVMEPLGGIAGYGPLDEPQIHVSGAALGLQAFNNCVGHPAGVLCGGLEIDALGDNGKPLFARQVSSS